MQSGLLLPLTKETTSPAAASTIFVHAPASINIPRRQVATGEFMIALTTPFVSTVHAWGRDVRV